MNTYGIYAMRVCVSVFLRPCRLHLPSPVPHAPARMARLPACLVGSADGHI